MFVRPRDREVDCHASAWDIDAKDDLRVKACLRVNADDFYTAHHELGHNMYQRAYQEQPVLFQDGANDGFHEAIGDFVGLNAVTPSYLREIGLIDKVPGPEADIPYLLRMALDKIAFLPFAFIVDKWRWQVFAGETTPERYNDAWWALRTQIPGRGAARPAPGRRLRPRREDRTSRATRPTCATSWRPSISSSSIARPAACRLERAAQPLLDLRQQGGRRALPGDAAAWARRSPGRRRSQPSPASATSTPARSSTTSRRSTAGSRSRTRAKGAGGEVAGDFPALVR